MRTHRRSGLLISNFALEKLFRYLINCAGGLDSIYSNTLKVKLKILIILRKYFNFYIQDYKNYTNLSTKISY